MNAHRSPGPHGRTVWTPCIRRSEPTPGTRHRWHFRRVFTTGPDVWDWWCGRCGKWYSDVTVVPDEVTRAAKRLGA